MNINKKLLILPVLLIGAVIITSVMVTGTNISVQSKYRETSKVQDQNSVYVEQIEKDSSLLSVTSKVKDLGYVSANTIQVRGGNGESLSMATK